ncbi:MAG: F0F1 ATP synthase subunit gamma [Prevotellaceae bacterium]|nr:F0F1 ATP synthase subunit gamma [Prevotellaceae bacterium]
MAQLKEIKERINSVKSTRKITSAMKMVSAAKLNRAQKNIAGMLPYSSAMHHILRSVLSSGEDFETSLSRQRPVERVAVVAFSSDSALAGSFNSNVVKELRRALGAYAHLPKESIRIYTIGKKVFEAVGKLGYTVARNFEGLAARPSYDVLSAFAGELIAQFGAAEVDRVEVIYHHFKSAGAQVLTRDVFLPLTLDAAHAQEEEEAAARKILPDYIVEPSSSEVFAALLPKSLKLKLYTMLLDSNASEHAARVIAMQLATDNADELINDLTIDYNKSRQQSITSELLDIIGGSMK